MTETTIDYSRKWYIMAAVAMSIFLATIDGSIVNVALPTLVRDLDTNFATVQWVVLSYLLTQTTLMLSIGRLGDMIGKKPLFTSGFVVFTVGSVLCGLAPTVYWLIAFRVLQAVGAALAITLGFAIITEAFPASERGKALGLNSTIVSVGVVLGPTLGGFIIESLSWRWIFYVNLPVGIIGTLMAQRYIPDFKPKGRQTFDYFGAMAMFIGLLSFLLALTWGQQIGYRQGQVILLLINALVFLVLFVVIEWNSAQPMVELSLFRDKLFSSNLLARLFTFIAISGMIILLPFYLENVLHYSTRQVGLLLVVVPICLGITSPLSGIVSDHWGARPIMIGGLVILCLGYLGLSTLADDTSTLGYVVRLLPIGIGMGIFQSPNNSAIMGAVPRERLGIASGLLSITRTLGQTSGIAILGAIWAGRTIYYSGTIPPEGATTAPVLAQVEGLQDTFMVTVGLTTVALCLCIWGLLLERRRKQEAVSIPAR